MTMHYKHRKKIIIGIILIVLVCTFLTLGYLFVPVEEEIIVFDEKVENNIEETIKEELEDITQYFQVDVKGQVNAPGTYKIGSGMRVLDAINLAGGLTGVADTSLINLSKKVYDEMVIVVYSLEEINNYVETKTKEAIKNEYCSLDNGLENDACIGDEIETDNVVNINLAAMEELMTLSGIGESKAKDIINYREEFGLFTVVEDLMKVPGIGESTFANIKENITV